MVPEKNVLLSLLRSTRAGPVSKLLLTKACRMPTQMVEKTLRNFSQMALFTEHGGVIEASPSQRVKMSTVALKLGADFERVCSLLSWSEFEGIAAQAFEANGYRVIRNFRFKNLVRRWEIDVIGLKKPMILCVECKHWRRRWRSAATARAAEAQIERTKALAEALQSCLKTLKLEEWQTARLTPLVLSLVQGPHKFFNHVPIVPILQLQDFISELPMAGDFLLVFIKKLQCSSR